MRKAESRALKRTRTWAHGIAAAAVFLSAAACADAPTGPDAAWVATETAAALRVAGDPPTLGRIVAKMRGPAAEDAAIEQGGDPADDREPVDRALSLWREAGKTKDRARARTLREQAYRLAAPRLARILGPAELTAMRTRMRQWINVAGRLPVADALGITRVLEDARNRLERSRAASEKGDEEAAITGILHAADLLNSLTPAAVADRMIRRADAAQSKIVADGTGDDGRVPPALQRADRLLSGARSARARGRPVRAIQRAYYALRLFESF